MNRLFDLYNNGTTVKTEILAGITSFLATMYIIAVNPAILTAAGMPFSGVVTATVLVSAFASIMMGLYAKNPIIIAPGMSINHLFVYSVVRAQGIPWETALGCVFWTGLIFFLLTVFDQRRRFLTGVPPMLRYGLAGGIGLFIALIGFETSGLINPAENQDIHSLMLKPQTVLFIVGFLLTAILTVRKIPGSFIFGIAGATVLAWPVGRYWWSSPETAPLAVWKGWFAAPDFSLLCKLDLVGALHPSLLPVIFIFLFSCFFDSLATCVGVCEAGNLIDESKNPRNLLESLQTNAVGVAVSACLGTSPATCYLESATGVHEGGRTGLTAVVTGLLFLPFLFLSPLLSLVPAVATAPVLILAGVFMLKPLIYVRWERLDDVIPFFMAMLIMPLTSSITQGIIWGCLTWTVVKAATGKWHQITPVLWVINILAIFLFLNSQFFSA